MNSIGTLLLISYLEYKILRDNNYRNMEKLEHNITIENVVSDEPNSPGSRNKPTKAKSGNENDEMEEDDTGFDFYI